MADLALGARFGNVGLVRRAVAVEGAKPALDGLLHLAARNKHACVVELLLAASADVNELCSEDTTPLHAAASPIGIEAALNEQLEVQRVDMPTLERRQRRVVEVLLAARADPNAGASPLLVAPAALVPALLAAGADPDRHGPLHAAIDRADLGAVTSLIAARASVELRGADGTPPLFRAAARGVVGVVAHLLDAGACVEGPDAQGPLLASIAGCASAAHETRAGHLAVLELLLSRGADATRQPTACMAARAGDVEALALLARFGARMHGVADASGEPPLHVAAGHGRVALVEALLGRRADVAERNVRGNSALYVAVECAQLEAAALLLARGADVDQHSDTYGTPLANAAFTGKAELIALLLAHGAGFSPRRHEAPLSLAARGGHLDCVRLLLAARADANAARLDTGATALHMACARGHVATARALIKGGARDRPCQLDGRPVPSVDGLAAGPVRDMLRRYRCAACRTLRATKLCRGCHAASYCHDGCQRLDWARHRPGCVDAQVERHRGVLALVPASQPVAVHWATIQLAYALLDGRSAEAEELMQRHLGAVLQRHGAAHWMSTLARGTLAHAAALLGRVEHAYELCVGMHHARTAPLASRDEECAAGVLNRNVVGVARALLRHGLPTVAATLMRLELLVEREHAMCVVGTRRMLGRALAAEAAPLEGPAAAEKLGEASAALRAATRLCAEVYGADHHRTGRARAELRRCVAAQVALARAAPES
jgi:ankyrin repeat protein